MKNPFSMFGSFLAVTGICVLISIHFEMNTLKTAICIWLGWFCYIKLAFAMLLAHGYGDKGVKTIAGMPIVLAIFITVIVGLSVSLLMMDYQPSDLPQRSIAIAKSFDLSIASGIAMGLCHWYFYARQAYFHQCECSPRTT